MRFVAILLALVTAALLQTTLFPFLMLAGFRPDLMLLVTVAFALREGALAGLRVGFTAGIISDLLLNQSPLGLSALVYLGVGYAIGLARPYLAPESITAPVIIAFLSGLLGTAGYGLLSRLLGDERYTIALVFQASAFVALYNTLMAPIVVGLVDRLTRRFPIEGAPAAR